MSALLLGPCLVAGAVAVGWPVGWPVRRPGAGPRQSFGRAAFVGSAIVRWPWRALGVAVGLAAGATLLVGGGVAAVVVTVYAGLGGRALIRSSERRRRVTARADALDGLVALAADLRAGLVVAGPGPVGPGGSGGRLGRLASAAWRLAERTGAPMADLVERIEADARAADRAAASATAQAAGAQATALLLAGLPLGGIALGVAIGADPIRVLTHTPIGAACAIGAVLLQGAGLLWADRLAAGVAR